MTEAGIPPTTPQAIAQAGRYTTDMGLQSPTTTRRSVLDATPLATLAATMPGTTLEQVKADQEIIAMCGEVIALEASINGPYADRLFFRQSRLLDRLATMRAATLDGFRAQAKAIMTCFPDNIDQTDSFACMVASLVSGLVEGVA